MSFAWKIPPTWFCSTRVAIPEGFVWIALDLRGSEGIPASHGSKPTLEFHPRGYAQKLHLGEAGLEKNLPDPLQSKGEIIILIRGWDCAPFSCSRVMSLAPSACDSTTALDSPPGLPAMAPPPLVGMFSAFSSPPQPHPFLPPLLLSQFIPLVRVSVHHGGARRRHLLLPAWRKTVATPGPEVRISSSQFSSPSRFARTC